VWEDFIRITALSFTIDNPPGANMTTSPVMRWLAEGLPLTLLCDLASTSAPDSAAINMRERPSGDPIWMDAAEAKTAWLQAASD
jgi:hypothetical protein